MKNKLLIIIIFIGLILGIIAGSIFCNSETLSPIPEEIISPIPDEKPSPFQDPDKVTEMIKQQIEDALAEDDQKVAKITAYSCGGLETEADIRMNCPSLFSGHPRTATGTEPIPYKTVACDRANLGRDFHIDGVGRVKCTDTGGAITGSGRFDLYVSDVHEARKWGVKMVAYREVL